MDGTFQVSGWVLLWSGLGLVLVGAFIGVLVASAMAAIGHAEAVEDGFRRGVDAATRPAPLGDRNA